MKVSTKALLLALCLILALVFQAPAVRAQEDNPAADAESSEGGAEESSEESSAVAPQEESTESTESTEESSPKETHESAASETTNKNGAKITIISNSNTLNSLAKQANNGNAAKATEAATKANQEQHQKKQDEYARKEKAEEKAKKQAAEQKQKEETAEQKKKDDEKKALENKKKAEQKSKEQAKKSAAEAAAKKAAAARAKAVEQAKKRAAEQSKKQRNISLRNGYRAYGYGYEVPSAWKWPGVNYCVLQGLARGYSGFIGYLPSNCRPFQGRIMFTQLRGGYNTRVDILADGRIYRIVGGTSDWISLDGISFDTYRQHGVSLGWYWRPYGYGWRHTGQSKYGDLCTLTGLIRHGRWNHFGRMMHSCWPRDGRLIFSACNHAHVTRIDVSTNGYFHRSGGYAYHHWVSLDGIAYTQYGGSRLSLYNGWYNYGYGYRYGHYKRVGKICTLSGLIRNRGGWEHHITTLPGGCRPKRRLIFGGNVHMRSARVDILPDGRVLYISHRMGWDWLSLSGIKFVAYR